MKDPNRNDKDFIKKFLKTNKPTVCPQCLIDTSGKTVRIQNPYRKRDNPITY